MLVAYEHHMKVDLTGYPSQVRQHPLGLYSKIVAVADGFDAATSRPANQTGVYPGGALVVLDTFELGIVHAVNPIPDMLSRPMVRVVSDAQGNVTHPGTLINLADRNEQGDYLRTIIKTEDPERYGIRVGDYFV